MSRRTARKFAACRALSRGRAERGTSLSHQRRASKTSPVWITRGSKAASFHDQQILLHNLNYSTLRCFIPRYITQHLYRNPKQQSQAKKLTNLCVIILLFYKLVIMWGSYTVQRPYDLYYILCNILLTYRTEYWNQAIIFLVSIYPKMLSENYICYRALKQGQNLTLNEVPLKRSSLSSSMDGRYAASADACVRADDGMHDTSTKGEKGAGTAPPIPPDSCSSWAPSIVILMMLLRNFTCK
jgi:hypothetical protein